MIILIIGVVILVVGILMATVGVEWDLEFFGGFVIFAGACWVVVCLFIIMGVKPDGERLILEYEQDRMYIESLYEEDIISLAERTKVVDLIMKDNNIINKYKVRSNSALYSVFYAKAVGELELFNVTKITNIKNELLLDKVN